MKMFYKLMTVISLAFLGMPGVWAGDLTLPNTFTSGTPAVAAEVNANFSAVETEVDDNNSRITASVVCPADTADTPTRFVDRGDGTICDSETGLMWERKRLADGTEGGNCADLTQAKRDVRCVNNTYTWTAVVSGVNPDGPVFTDFLAQLNDLVTPNDGTATTCFAGHCDWRVATIGELRSILLAPFPFCFDNGISPCIAAGFLGPTQAFAYWSSSSFASDPGTAWRATFNVGFVGFASKFDARPVRAVRGGR